MDLKQIIIDLENKIRRASEMYYNTGTPILTDDEFDSLVEELRTVDPSNPILTKAGWGAEANPNHLEEFPHSHIVTGLNQIKIAGFNDSLLGEDTYINSDKLDGISIVLYYDKHGKFIRALTRHHGTVGLDITKNLRFCNIPKQVAKGIESVRGEVLISFKDFESMTDYSNPRNAASGICMSAESSPEMLRKLSVVVYNIPTFYSGYPLPETYEQVLKLLDVCGFDVVNYSHMPSNCLGEYLKTRDPAILHSKFLLDGAVIRSNHLYAEELSENIVSLDSATQYKIKYPTKHYQTVCEEVIWQCSGYGRLAPTVKFQTIDMNGVSVSYASGFNAKFILDNGIGPGAVVLVSRRNEVIPQIEEVIKPVEVELPIYEQGLQTFWDGVHLRINVDRQPQIVRSLILSCAPKGLGGMTVVKFTESAGLTKVEGLVKFLEDPELVMEVDGLYDHHYELIKQAFIRMKTEPTTPDWALTMSWTDGMGDSTAGRICEKLTREQLMEVLDGRYEAYLEDLDREDFDGSSDKVCDDLFNSCTGSTGWHTGKGSKNILSILKLPLNWVEYGTETKPEAKYTVMITGKLSKPRGKLLEEWAPYGVVEGSPVMYLISDQESDSSKFKTARANNIPIVTEAEFRKLIGA